MVGTSLSGEEQSISSVVHPSITCSLNFLFWMQTQMPHKVLVLCNSQISGRKNITREIPEESAFFVTEFKHWSRTIFQKLAVHIERCFCYENRYRWYRDRDIDDIDDRYRLDIYTHTQIVYDAEYGTGCPVLWMQRWFPKCKLNIQWNKFWKGRKNGLTSVLALKHEDCVIVSE